MARNPTFIKVVEIKALIGGGATECASMVTVCIGKRPIFVLNPVSTNTKAIFRYSGLALLITWAKEAKDRFGASPRPYINPKNSIPRYARAIPVEQIKTYFQVASRAISVRSRKIRNP